MTTNPRSIASEYDVVIVGARVAGASTAMLLARQGLRVLVVDRGRPGTDTLSTHALMRPAVWLLSQWGLLDEIRAAATPAIHSTAFHYGDDVLDIPITPTPGVDALYAPRRTIIDRLLVDAAVAAGAHVAFGVGFRGALRDDAGRVCGARLRTAGGEVVVRSRLVVGADGVHSTVAREVGAHVVEECSYASGTIYAYFAGVAGDRSEWFWGRRVAAGRIPTNDGLTCVFVSVPSRRLREQLAGAVESTFWNVLQEATPSFAQKLRGGLRASGFRGHGGHVGYLRRAHGPGWVLVGDAGYFKDPLTAHGMTDALRDAALLARCIDHDGTTDLGGYETTRDALSREMLSLTDEVASFRWNLPQLQQLHRRLSGLMKQELQVLDALVCPPSPLVFDTAPTSATAT